MLDDGSTREYITNGTIDRYIERWNGKVKVNIFVQQKKMGSPLYNNHFNEIIPLLIERFMNRACIRMGFFLDPKFFRWIGYSSNLRSLPLRFELRRKRRKDFATGKDVYL